MTDPTDANAAGWFPDPAGLYHQRLWSGDAWTPRVADAYGVTAVHHLDGDFIGPDGSAVRTPPPPARAAGPTLSLVGAEPAPPPVPLAPPAPEPAVVERPPAVVLPEPEPVVVVPPGPRAAGWYPDPCGIHPERSWDGNAWSAFAVDRNRMVLEHAMIETYLGPADASPALARTRGPHHIDLVAGTVPGPASGGDGWQFDPTGPFRERYVVAGRASGVVRTVRGNAPVTAR